LKNYKYCVILKEIERKSNSLGILKMITFFTCWLDGFFIKLVWLLRRRKRNITVIVDVVVRRGLQEIYILTIICEILNTRRINSC